MLFKTTRIEKSDLPTFGKPIRFLIQGRPCLRYLPNWRTPLCYQTYLLGGMQKLSEDRLCNIFPKLKKAIVKHQKKKTSKFKRVKNSQSCWFIYYIASTISNGFDLFFDHPKGLVLIQTKSSRQQFKFELGRV